MLTFETDACRGYLVFRTGPTEGVVSLGERNMQAAVDKLSDAHALCKALTVDPIAVEELLRLGAPEEGAIVALRKSNGDVQRAAGEGRRVVTAPPRRSGTCRSWATW